MVRGEVTRGELVEVLAAHATVGPTIYSITTTARRMPAKVRAFIDLMAETFRLDTDS